MGRLTVALSLLVTVLALALAIAIERIPREPAPVPELRKTLAGGSAARQMAGAARTELHALWATPVVHSRPNMAKRDLVLLAERVAAAVEAEMDGVKRGAGAGVTAAELNTLLWMAQQDGAFSRSLGATADFATIHEAAVSLFCLAVSFFCFSHPLSLSLSSPLVPITSSTCLFPVSLSPHHLALWPFPPFYLSVSLPSSPVFFRTSFSSRPGEHGVGAAGGRGRTRVGRGHAGPPVGRMAHAARAEFDGPRRACAPRRGGGVCILRPAGRRGRRCARGIRRPRHGGRAVRAGPVFLSHVPL